MNQPKKNPETGTGSLRSLDEVLDQYEVLARSANPHERYQASTFLEQILPICQQLLRSAEQRKVSMVKGIGIERDQIYLENNRGSQFELEPGIHAQKELHAERTNLARTILQLKTRLQTMLVAIPEQDTGKTYENIRPISDPMRLLTKLHGISAELKALGISI
ncbi:MAG: hypothetical protein A2V81_01855 [Candidatus Abawacabacteria bacterium RBG_16_42_10]|uniref:Uncharacterized protein n=1 Tax=Candidatus Abawacabacteria bacterium RBG_16_42_10 TaxID=1817814 RepID=A0A1F4XKM8_9BACT|nr:MAG: hypothetical protein A2V81_01855 [Candidatus Abawacabacteria bacterium RBG_16_42_10]